jgi:hypothetical protein
MHRKKETKEAQTCSLTDDLEEIVRLVRSRIINPHVFDPNYEFRELTRTASSALLASAKGARVNSMIQAYSIIDQTRDIINTKQILTAVDGVPQSLAVYAAMGRVSGFGLCGEVTADGIIETIKYARTTGRDIFPITRVQMTNPKSSKRNTNHTYYMVRDKKGKNIVVDILLGIVCPESEYWKHKKLNDFMKEIDIDDLAAVALAKKMITLEETIYTKEGSLENIDLLETQLATFVRLAKPQVDIILHGAQEQVLSFLFTKMKPTNWTSAPRYSDHDPRGDDDVTEYKATL